MLSPKVGWLLRMNSRIFPVRSGLSIPIVSRVVGNGVDVGTMVNVGIGGSTVMVGEVDIPEHEVRTVLSITTTNNCICFFCNIECLQPGILTLRSIIFTNLLEVNHFLFE
jgi:hypothetical protein